MGGYVVRESVAELMRADIARTGKPTGPNDAVLDFNYTKSSFAGKFPVSMDDLKGTSSLLGDAKIPQKLLDGMARNGEAVINYLSKKGINIKDTAEFVGFDVETNGVVDAKKVGAVLLAAASVSRVGGGKNNNPSIIGATFDNQLSFKELETLQSPGGFHFVSDDHKKIQDIANTILKDHVLGLAKQVGQGTGGSIHLDDKFEQPGPPGRCPVEAGRPKCGIKL